MPSVRDGELEIWNKDWRPWTRPDDMVTIYCIRCVDDFPYVGTSSMPLERFVDQWTEGRGAIKCWNHKPARVMWVLPGWDVRWRVEKLEARLINIMERYWYELDVFVDIIPALAERARWGCETTRALLVDWEDVDDLRERIYKATDNYTPGCARSGPPDATPWVRLVKKP